MTITAELVRELRERTGAGMMECKKALVATSGDIDAAIEEMRKAGSVKAEKKGGRVAAEGLVFILTSDDQKRAVMVEVNCETDFVARDESFKQFVEKVAATALSANETDVAKLSALPIDAGMTIEQARAELVAKIGENVQIRRVVIMQADKGTIGNYVHGGRIGVLTELMGGDAEISRGIAMHVVANSPLVVERDQVPAELIDKEKEIFSAQAQTSGKPANIIEKMVEGRINKFLDEVSLVGQPYVKNPDMTVGQLLKQSNAKVISFTRFAVGEGIEKTSENFVDAVMAQVRGS